MSASRGNSSPATIQLDDAGDRILILTVDNPEGPINTMGEAFSREFEAAVARLEGSGDARGVVVISGKKDNFLAGADLKLLARLDSAAKLADAVRRAQKTLQRLADLPVPVVCAIHGDCLGGGLELALACDVRMATSHPATKLGLPEVQVGLLPAAGGTQRLPRLLGLQAALDMILTGKRVSAQQAHSLGLVDELVPAPVLRRCAIELAASLAGKKTEPKVSPVSRLTSTFRQLLAPEEIQELLVADNPVGRKLVFDQAKKRLLAKTRGNYPAPERALEAMRIGMSQGISKGLEAEAEFFAQLATSRETKELLGIFTATRELKKDRGVDDPAVEPRPVTKIGIMGAGLMGAGIAYVTAAQAHLPVRLKDRDSAAVGRGLAAVREILDGQLARKRISPRERDELMNRVSPATDYSGLKDADIVIEAVFEDLALKREILRDVEAHGRADLIFASNTSTIPIGRIAEASAHPETVIGMHYFSPVHKMPLLEVIVTDKTAPWVTATCVALGKQQGKTVIVVRDGVGFYTSRIVGPYMNEALHLVAEGVPIELIDNALLDFGFPVGPIKLLDEVGIDVAHKASRIVGDALGHRHERIPGFEALIADGRCGRKTKKGFYLYGGKKKGVDPSVYRVLGIEGKRELPAPEIAHRCVLQMVNEAAHCFGEGILRCARDGDMGAILGLGFPPFRGGPFRFADAHGIGKLLSELEALYSTVGRRYAPAPILGQLAREGGAFHGDDARPGAIPGELPARAPAAAR